MKLWIDDVRPAPDGYIWAKSVMMAQAIIEVSENEACECYAKAVREFEHGNEVSFFEWIDKGSKLLCEIIDIDHDAGDFVCDGGDYIKLLDWFEETGRNYPIRIHSQNPVGVANMRRIIERNGWEEV
jgi:hypothetical protein